VTSQQKKLLVLVIKILHAFLTFDFKICVTQQLVGNNTASICIFFSSQKQFNSSKLKNVSETRNLQRQQSWKIVIESVHICEKLLRDDTDFPALQWAFISSWYGLFFNLVSCANNMTWTNEKQIVREIFSCT